MIKLLYKRDGRLVEFCPDTLYCSLSCALQAADCHTPGLAQSIGEKAIQLLTQQQTEPVQAAQVHKAAYQALVDAGYTDAAEKFDAWRRQRTGARQADSPLMQAIHEITYVDARLSDMKRDNANIDGNTAMGSMLQIGTAGAKAYNAAHMLRPEQAKAHQNGDIHIHDFDFYALTTTCCQIDLIRLFEGGFSTGHGYLREPASIGSYAALAAIAIQSNQNDQHGGQSIPNFDYAMAKGVAKTFARLYNRHLSQVLEDLLEQENCQPLVEQALAQAAVSPRLETDAQQVDEALCQALCNQQVDASIAAKAVKAARRRATQQTERDTYQAMEGFIHNLNTMHSRAGAQTPFSSINYGTDTSPEGRLAIRMVLLAQDAGLGHGETPIFPIHIFKVKDGVNYNPEDPNYDLFQLSMKVSAKRLFPNYVFLDAPFNLQYYRPGHPETEVATMGCRTRVMGNTFDPSREISYSRGNLSFTSINLPRLALKAKGDEASFFLALDSMMELVSQQLLDRFEIQARKRVYNYPFLMGQGVWLDSDQLGPDDELREVLRHGTLSIGFIGLAETLTALYGHHHGESEEMQQKGLALVQYMRDFCDRKSQEYQMNFSLLATPAEGLAGRFTRMDQKEFGSVPGVTDREYYTNSFHIPVWFPISAYEKIQKEAPYHALTNAGHISYVELDGDTAQNLEAFESVVRCMHDSGIGYGSINHPVDRDPVCGYVGVIGDVCPRCGRRSGEALSPEKIEELRKKYPRVPSLCGCR